MSRREIPTSIESGNGRFYYGYVIVIAGVLVAMVVYGAQFSFGVFFKPVLSDFGWTREETSGVFTLYMIMQGTSGAVTGRLTERFGPRPIVTVCGLLLGAGYMLTSQINSLWQIYLCYGVLAGLGTGGYLPILATVAKWFDKRRGMMTGIFTAGIGAGTMIMPPIANQLITNNSWRFSYFVVGCACLVIVVIGAQFLRRAPEMQFEKPEESAAPVSLQVKGLSLSETLRTRQFWSMIVVFFALVLCVNTVMIHVVPHATDIGISAASAAGIISAIGGLSILGKIVAGTVSDRVKSKLLIVITAALMMTLFFFVGALNELWMFYLFAVFFGFAYGGAIALYSPAIAEYFGMKAHSSIVGLVFLAVTLGGGVGPLIAGGVFDATGGYQLAFLIDALLVAVGLILTILFLKPVAKLKG